MTNAPLCVTGATGVGRYDAAWPKIEAEWYMGATACEKVQADAHHAGLTLTLTLTLTLI